MSSKKNIVAEIQTRLLTSDGDISHHSYIFFIKKQNFVLTVKRQQNSSSTASKMTNLFGTKS